MVSGRTHIPCRRGAAACPEPLPVQNLLFWTYKLKRHWHYNLRAPGDSSAMQHMPFLLHPVLYAGARLVFLQAEYRPASSGQHDSGNKLHWCTAQRLHMNSIQAGRQTVLTVLRARPSQHHTLQTSCKLLPTREGLNKTSNPIIGLL